MKVIIAGSRDIGTYWDGGRRVQLKDLTLVDQAVAESSFNITEVVSGHAKGVDILGEYYAKENNLPVSIFLADWDNLGKRAGALRNIQMGDYADALIAIRLNQSKGTSHMIAYMQKLGKKVYVIDILSGGV